MKQLVSGTYEWASSAVRHRNTCTSRRLNAFAMAQDVPIEVEKPLPWDSEFKRTFLKRYWHKQPLLVRGAFPSGWQSPIGSNELAGLACEEAVDARVVLEVQFIALFETQL
jgi:hypothetical protein